jgi:hypothetical protein
LTINVVGNTVNTVSKMEHYDTSERVHVSHGMYKLTSSMYEYELRGEIDVKGEFWREWLLIGKGIMKTYFLIKKKDVKFKSAV